MTLLKTRQIDFTQGSILRNAIIFTIPVFFANIFSSLYSIVDATVCGQFVGSAALAAVSASYALNMVLVALCAGLGIGTSVVISQFYGAKRMDDVSRAIGTALLSAVSICAVLSVTGFAAARPLLQLLHTPEDILPDAVTYFRITMVGFAGQLLYGMSSGLLRGVGDSSFPAMCIVISSVLNIFLDLLFVAVFHWGVAGVAWATVLAQYLSASLPLRRLLSRRYGYTVTRDCFRIRLTYLKTILRIGLFSALNMMVTSLGLMLIQRCSNAFGTNLVAANGVVQKVDTFAQLPMTSIGGTISTFCAQVMGAGEQHRAKAGAVKCILLACGIALLIGGTVAIAAGPLLRLFINKNDAGYAEVVSAGVRALRILAPFYLLYALEQGLFCILQGAGALRPAMMATALAMAIRVALTFRFAGSGGSFDWLYWSTGLFYAALVVFYGLYLKFGSMQRYLVRQTCPEE